MFITERQFRDISVSKKSCQKSLEEYVVASHMGDKKEYARQYASRGSSPHKDSAGYIYLNNPIYRVGPEGDPSPGSLSSRHFQQDIKPTESMLHSLYPTIDSGSIFLTEKPWDNRWRYQRDNIPNSTEDDISDQRLFSDIVYQDASLDNYDENVRKYLNDWDEKEKQTRYLPIYDQAGINDKLVPDGVHQTQFYVPPPPIPKLSDQLPPGTHLIENYAGTKEDREGKLNKVLLGKSNTNNKPCHLNSPCEFRPSHKGEGLIENYQGPGNGSMRNNTSGTSSGSRSTMNNRNGYYGYPKPSIYATMGETDGIYYVSPQSEVESTAPAYSNEVFHSGTSTYGGKDRKPFAKAKDLDSKEFNPYPCDRNIEGYENMSNTRLAKKKTGDNYKIWYLIAIVIILFLVVMFGFWRRKKMNRR